MPKSTDQNWGRDDTLIAFRLYCRTPFGKLHKTNPQIVRLARLIKRTPSAVGMKACNFASLDPKQRERGIKALPNASNLMREIWHEFEQNPEAIAAEAEAAYERLTQRPPDAAEGTRIDEWVAPAGDTDREQLVRVRRVQGFFRATVLTSYEHKCGVTGLDVPDLLNASHIIPWSASAERRADPRNGVCLHALLDRAFDRGLITFDNDLTLIVSPHLRRAALVDTLLAPDGIEGARLRPPKRFAPDTTALAHHREHVFRS